MDSITVMSDTQIMEVIKARMEGKQIQFQAITDDRWTDLVFLHNWNFTAFNYRVKP